MGPFRVVRGDAGQPLPGGAQRIPILHAVFGVVLGASVHVAQEMHAKMAVDVVADIALRAATGVILAIVMMMELLQLVILDVEKSGIEFYSTQRYTMDEGA